MRTNMTIAVRALAIAAALATTTAVTLGAQEPAPVTSVLLATQQCTYTTCGPVTTYLVVRQGGRVRVAAQGSGLLVPRRDGFWWLDARDGYASGWREDEPPEGLTTCDSVLLGLRPPVDTTQSDTVSDAPTERAGGEDDDPSRLSGFRGVRADGRGGASRVVRTGGYGNLAWRWVGAEWAAFTEYTSVREDEEHTRESWHSGIFSLDELARPATDTIAVTLFDPDGAAFVRAAKACRRALGGDGTDADREWIAERATVEWMVWRGPTSWTLAPTLYTENVITDAPGEPCAAPRGLGASMIGHDRVTVAWSAIKDVLPEATTAFESPAGDVLLVQQDSTLHAFLPQAGRLGAPVARFPVAGGVVMAQWAVGAHASRWAREVPPLLAKGAPVFADDSTSKR